MIDKKLFGTLNGKAIYCYTLTNQNKTSVEILSFGGIIRSIIFDGVDVALGRDTIDEYLNNEGYFGAIIGRNSNRIENAEFVIGGQKYALDKNDGNNSLHSGPNGFDTRIWSVTESDNECAITLTLDSEHLDQGFPGNATITVTYTLTEKDELVIKYNAKSDADTVMNLTNHCYFNLNGHDSGTVDGHTLWLGAHFFTPNSDECMPTGEILSVVGTPFDLTTPKTLSEGFVSDYEQIKMFGGYDHNFVLDGEGLRLSGRLVGDKTGITMEMLTDREGVQLYTGNVIEQNRICKDGAEYPIHGGLCLETQCFPNALKYSHFKSPILKKGEIFDSITIYRFSK